MPPAKHLPGVDRRRTAGPGGLELDLSRRRSRFGGCSGLVSSLSGGICSAGGVHHLPDELFEDVFKCNQAADLAVLVDQAGEV